MASIIRYSDKPGRLLFANPHNLDRAASKPVPGQIRDSKNLSVKLSEDDGKTWTASRTLEAGFSDYSDLAVGPVGTIYCLYERSTWNGSRTRSDFTHPTVQLIRIFCFA